LERDNAYTLEVSIREQSSAASNDGPTALPSRLWKCLERDLRSVDARFRRHVGVVLLHDEDQETVELDYSFIEALRNNITKRKGYTYGPRKLYIM
jgi:hypothetical protein